VYCCCRQTCRPSPKRASKTHVHKHKPTYMMGRGMYITNTLTHTHRQTQGRNGYNRNKHTHTHTLRYKRKDQRSHPRSPFTYVLGWFFGNANARWILNFRKCWWRVDRWVVGCWSFLGGGGGRLVTRASGGFVIHFANHPFRPLRNCQYNPGYLSFFHSFYNFHSLSPTQATMFAKKGHFMCAP